MVAIFISISFIIHALTLAALYALYHHMKQINNSETKDIDAMMQTYIKQIQKENDELKETLQMYNETPNRSNGEAQTVADSNDHKQNEATVEPTPLVAWNVEEVVELPEEDSVETSLESRVLQLHREGISIDEIAKQLHCGKTEASLIIQFQQSKG